MNEFNADKSTSNLEMDRRQSLKCMAMWAGSGVMWSLVGGIPKAFAAGTAASEGPTSGVMAAVFSFGQISDTHIGFNKPANPDPTKTTQEAISKLNLLKPNFVLHTGDISHLSKPEQFDTAAEIMKSFQAPVHYVPGEHDTLDEGGRKIISRSLW